MSRAADTTQAANPRASGTIPVAAWVGVPVIGGLFIWLHWQILATLGAIAIRDPDWSHSFLVPVLSAYFIYHHRENILAEPATGSWLGLPIFLMGLFGYFFAVYPAQSIMLRGWMAILELLGICLLLLGPRIMRWVWFPVCYLAFGVKFSARIWDMVAWHLQLIAAQSSVILMNLFGLDAEVKGATIDLWRGAHYLGALNVAEACSGLRMLVAFTALGFAIVYLVPRPLWVRFLLIVLTVPIAVAVNVLRVTITGFLHLISPELSAGDFHIMVGMLMVFPAVAMFLGVGWVLDHLFLEGDEEDFYDDLQGDSPRGE